MYTIMMLNDKSLVVTSKTTLYQREKLADKIQFLFPQNYGDLNLSEFTATLKYVDQGNEVHTETLKPDEKPYKNMLRFVLPINTELNRFAGDVIMRITLSKTDIDENEYILYTGETTISISPISDYFQYVPNESIEILNQKIIELDERIKTQEELGNKLDSSKADDLSYENNKLSLLAKGKKVGNEVEIDQLEVVEFGNKN